MDIKELLKKDIMIMDLKAKDKIGVIDEMISRLDDQGYLIDKEEYRNEILRREESTSTGLGDGVAMPHAKIDGIKEPFVLFARSEEGIDFEALDGEKTYLFFMIGAREGAHDSHLETLAALSRLMIKEGFIDRLKAVKTADEVIDIIDNEEKTVREKEIDSSGDRPFIVAVTACPTGIAHTYMAEEALIQEAKKMGIDIKVETNGSEGVKNKLSREEIERALGVIVAADTKVDINRFSGKRVLQRRVTDGIKKPDELIDKILKEEAPIFKGEDSDDVQEEKPQGLMGKLYQDIMNGISHMLPFVVAGGILIAISFLFERFLGDDSTIFQFLNGVGSGAFQFLIPVLAGYIAISIGDRPALMPGMVAGYIASQGAGFLGGLIGGLLAGYIMIWIKNISKNIPKQFEGLKPILIYPVLGLFLTGLLMYFIIDPVFSIINLKIESILLNLGTVNSVILGAVLGGMMAVDMGGPVNKAAYAFSIGIFTDTGNGAFMAAVMAGGMVPPLAIALATSIFKNKFSENERQAGFTNYILGLSFITEGAIPFAAGDPLRVIGSSIVGAAVAGGLTQLWEIQSPAPHGGIFILPAMSLSKGLLFILAVLIGSIISGLIYGMLKQKEV